MVRNRRSFRARATGANPARFVGTLLVLALLIAMATINSSSVSHAQPASRTSFETITIIIPVGESSASVTFNEKDNWWHNATAQPATGFLFLAQPGNTLIYAIENNLEFLGWASSPSRIGVQRPRGDDRKKPRKYVISVKGTENDHGSSHEDPTIIQLNTPVKGTKAGWDLDWFSFQATEGQKYFIDLDYVDYKTRANFRGDLSIFDLQYDVDDASRYIGDWPMDRGYLFHFTAVENSQLLIQLRGFRGAYTLTISSDDHGENRETARELTIGVPEPGVIDYKGDVDMFVFEAQEGWIYQLTTTNVTGSVIGDLYLGYLEPYEGPKREEGAQSVIENWVAPSTRRYFYSISNIIKSGAAYILEVRGEQDDHVNLAEDDATALNMNGVTEGKIQYLGDTDVFAFEAKKNWVYHIGTAFAGQARFFPGDSDDRATVFPGSFKLHRRTAPGSFLPSKEVPAHLNGPYRQRPDWADDPAALERLAAGVDPMDTRPRAGLTDKRSGFGEPGYRLVPVTPAEFRSASFANEPIAFRAPEAGTYYIYVSKLSKNQIAYTVSINGKPDDHGDDVLEATSVPLTRNDSGDLPRLFGSVTGEIQIPDGFNTGGYDLDLFTFDVMPDWLYRTEGELGSMRTLRLAGISSDGAFHILVVRKNPKSDDPPPVLELSPRFSSKAVISIRSFSEFGVLAYHSGTYTVRITAELDDHADAATNSPAIEVGASKPGVIQNRSDEDWFSFEAEAGVKYDIFVDLISLERTGLDLIDRDASTHLTTKVNLTQSDGDPSILDWVAPNSGTYYLSVWNLLEAYPEFDEQTKAKVIGTYEVKVVRSVRSDGSQPSVDRPSSSGTMATTNQESGQGSKSSRVPDQATIAGASSATQSPQPNPTKTPDPDGSGAGCSAPTGQGGAADLSLLLLFGLVGLMAAPLRELLRPRIRVRFALRFLARIMITGR